MPNVQQDNFNELIHTMDGLVNAPGSNFRIVETNVLRLNLLDIVKYTLVPPTANNMFEQTLETLRLILLRILRIRNPIFNQRCIERLATEDSDYYQRFPIQSRIKTYRIYYYVDYDVGENIIVLTRMINNITNSLCEFINIIDTAEDEDRGSNEDLHSEPALLKTTWITNLYPCRFLTDGITLSNGRTRIHLQIYNWRNKTGFTNYRRVSSNEDISIFAFGAGVPTRFKFQVQSILERENSNNVQVAINENLEQQPLSQFLRMPSFSQFECIFSTLHLANYFSILAVDGPTNRRGTSNENDPRDNILGTAFRQFLETVYRNVANILFSSIPNHLITNNITLNYTKEFVKHCTLFLILPEEEKRTFAPVFQHFKVRCLDIIRNNNNDYLPIEIKTAYMVIQSINRVQGNEYEQPITVLNSQIPIFSNQTYDRDFIDEQSINSFIRVAETLKTATLGSATQIRRVYEMAEQLSIDAANSLSITDTERGQVVDTLNNLFLHSMSNPRNSSDEIFVPTSLEQNYSAISEYFILRLVSYQSFDIVAFTVLYILLQSVQKRQDIGPVIPFVISNAFLSNDFVI